MKSSIEVYGHALAPAFIGYDRSSERVVAAIDAKLTASGLIDLVVLPKIGTLDYARSYFDRMDEMAEPLDDSPTIDRFA